jgi:hypothetical protein
LFGEFSYIRAAQKCSIRGKSSKLKKNIKIFSEIFTSKTKFLGSNQGGEVHRRNLRIAVGTVVVAMNIGTSSHGNGVRSAMFFATLFDAEQVLQ